MIDPKVRALLDAAAALYELPRWGGVDLDGIPGIWEPGEWLAALVLTESSFDPRAKRYEPQLDKLPDGDTPQADDGATEDDTSWGPMQVLGLNVKALLNAQGAERLNYSVLQDWLIGVGFGMKILIGSFRRRDTSVDVALARYNGGWAGNPRSDGTLRNQAYVDRVWKNCAIVRAT